MFDDSLYSQAVLRTREPRVSARAARDHWANIDAQLTALMVRKPTEIWLRQNWVVKEGENDCGKAKLVLRYKHNYPPQLQEFITVQEWQAFIMELNSADEVRDGCIDKCTGMTLFILLFYFTIIGIFFYMCAEYKCNKDRVRDSMKRKKACLARFNSKFASRGILIAGRYDYRVSEADDQGMDSNGDVINDFPYLCITLPRPATILMVPTATNIPIVTPNGVMMPYGNPNQPMMMPPQPNMYPLQPQGQMNMYTQQPQPGMYPPQPMQQAPPNGMYPPQQPNMYPPQQQQPNMYPPQNQTMSYPSANGYDKNNTGYPPMNTINPAYGGMPQQPPNQTIPPQSFGVAPYPPMNTPGIMPSAPPSDDPM